MPGFRKGKAPPSLVIQRLGFGPVLEEAIREALPEWYERALLDIRRQPDRRPRASRWSRPPTDEGEPLAVQVRGRRAAAGQARRLQGPRGRPQRGGGARRDRRHRDRAGPRGLRPPGAGRARGRRGRLAADRLRGLDRRRRLRGRQGRGLPARARLRPADRGLRGAADRRQGGRGARGQGDLPRRTTRPSTWPAKTRSSRSRSRRCGRKSCPSSTTTSPPRPPSSTRWRSCAPTSARKSATALGSRAEEDFRIAADRRRRRCGDGRGAGGAGHGPRDRTLGADGTPARPARHGPQRRSCRCRARPARS